jgi:DNA-binding SARP family transcriptional activator
MELLCYLLLHRERGHAREALAGRLWPDSSESLARKYLRQAIWRLQSALVGSDLLIAHSGWIRINPKAVLWLDVAAFEEAHDIYRDTPGRELTDRQAQALEVAVALYRGELIEAWYQDWCVYERDRLQLVYLAMMEQLMSNCEARQRYTQGVAYGQRILRYDPARECTHRNLMRLYYQAGDRTTALRQYERCAAATAKEFNVPPSRETVALYHQVRGDRLGTAPDIAGAGSEVLRGLQASLDHIQASLTALQGQVQQHLAPAGQMQEAG